MKKTGLKKFAAFLFALVLSVSIVSTYALAADETTVPSVTTATTAVTDQATKIAEFKAEVVRLVNIERAKVGAAALTNMDALGTMANVRAEESATSFKHTRPNGTRCFTIFADNGMVYSAAGENLAYGFSTPAAVVKAWMNSEGHRKNILHTSFKNIGIGYFVTEGGKIYCSQLFYTPKTSK